MKVDSNIASLASSTARQGFCYTGLGEERRRVTADGDGAALDGCQAEGDSRTTTSFDPAGHADEVKASNGPDVDYLYDADGSVIARTKTKDDGSTNTTYFFYFGLTRRLAEEATPQGRTKVRYFVNSTGEALAQERYEITGVDAVDDADPGTWTWLLKDPHGSVGTHVKSDGTVTKQASYDPYGAPDAGGTTGSSNSTFGFQSDHTDDATGKLLLGARQYDPEIDRFTTADFFVGSGSDLSLGTDPLTGNRYLFAAANPVAFYDDGHEPCPANPCNKYYSGTKKQQRTRASSPSYSLASHTSTWSGSAGAHEAVLNELHSRLCGFGFWPVINQCEMERQMPSSRARADLLIGITSEIYEVKPDKPSSISKGRAQVRRYVSELNSAGEYPMMGEPWGPGAGFEEFDMDYLGHRLIVTYRGGGVAAYRPDCAPDCDADLDLDTPTMWNRVTSILNWIPMRASTRVPVLAP